MKHPVECRTPCQPAMLEAEGTGPGSHVVAADVCDSHAKSENTDHRRRPRRPRSFAALADILPPSDIVSAIHL